MSIRSQCKLILIMRKNHQFFFLGVATCTIWWYLYRSESNHQFCWSIYMYKPFSIAFSAIQLYRIQVCSLSSSCNLKFSLCNHAVKPKKGDALLFFSLNPDATTDTHSLHGSCPVIEGEKWSATKWIHVRSFEKSVKQEGMGGKGDCVDENENCPVWAKAGECKKNPLYMVGDDGKCRKSCKVCSS